MATERPDLFLGDGNLALGRAAGEERHEFFQDIARQIAPGELLRVFIVLIARRRLVAAGCRLGHADAGAHAQRL